MKCNELLRLLKRNGWKTVRQKGSHLIMAHPGKSRQIVVPSHGSKEIKKGTLSAILKDAEFKMEGR